MKQQNELYLPLNQDLSSDINLITTGLSGTSTYWRKKYSPSWAHSITIILILSNICFLLLYILEKRPQAAPEDYARIGELPIKWARFDWWTEYSDKNETRVDELWDAILPSHGFVAIDRKWAAEQHWPESMRLPSDANKGVYLLEAYHQMHCIRIIRKTFWELAKGQKTTYPVTHSGHCFDTIRQYIYCNADNTPLYTFGDDTAGDRQMRKCRDWNALRDFATQNTACYKDSVKPIVLGDHFGYCDDGNDGVIDAKPANVTHSLDAFG